jgi:hypothetical protein
MDANSLEGSEIFIFRVEEVEEDGNSRFLRNVCAYLPDYTASHPRRPSIYNCNRTDKCPRAFEARGGREVASSLRPVHSEGLCLVAIFSLSFLLRFNKLSFALWVLYKAQKSRQCCPYGISCPPRAGAVPTNRTCRWALRYRSARLLSIAERSASQPRENTAWGCWANSYSPIITGVMESKRIK